ncbi:MAG: hypothetical protein JO257_01470 [Deltaproteobacteria bacterium]|nr:hypothetical protein [Deltaproteobacteria bacterium]
MKSLLIVIALAACSKSEAKQPPKHEDRADPAEAVPPLALHVTIDGTPSTWQQDAFDKTPHFLGANKSGESRDAWSLRELAHTMVGPNARVVAVIGDKRKEIDAAAWADATKTPFVHRTRRGWLKFRWAEKDGTWDEADVKDVSGLEIVR